MSSAVLSLAHCISLLLILDIIIMSFATTKQLLLFQITVTSDYFHMWKVTVVDHVKYTAN
jgi:hypothetical protein